MFVSEKMAREAADLLAFPNLEAVDVDGVKDHYRVAARGCHPDAGGSAEVFVQVDRAKHVLLAWLARAPQAAPAHVMRSCARCDGRGYMVLSSGLPGRPGLRRQCPECHGSGDADYDKHGLA
jgi:DnaJ-class molecular chaperone